jgi:flagellar biosynthesis protein FlhA
VAPEPAAVTGQPGSGAVPPRPRRAPARPARAGAPSTAPAQAAGEERSPRPLGAGDILVGGAGLVVALLLLAPLAPWVVDLVIVASLAGSALALAVAAYTTDPLQFSAFPSILLAATVLRVAVNVALARLILLGGSAGGLAAAFGQVVMGGSPVVGFVLFVILMIAQFVVIGSGAGRIAEVAARFTLDAMPGKQMAIDADLNAGVITEQEARERRRAIEQQADFYGAMDGASKFVRGDAVASAVIVLVDLVGGIALGAFGRGMDLLQAARTYTTLTVGAGLATQVPALLMSTASGLLVTRAASRQELGIEVTRQLSARPEAALLAGVLVGAVGLIPGMPALPLLGAGALMAGAGILRRRPAPPPPPRPASVRDLGTPQALQQLLELDPLELRVGTALAGLAQGSDLADRLVMARRQVTQQLGILAPPIRIRDGLDLPPRAYAIHVWGAEAGRGELYPDRLMALAPSPQAPPLEGVAGSDPAFGTPAVWIERAREAEAARLGWLVVPPAAVIATHVAEVMRRHAADLLTRQMTRDLVERLRPQHGVLLEELIPKVVTMGLVQRVLQGLLREGVGVGNLVRILEAVGDAAQAGTRDPAQLVEVARRALGPALWQPHLRADRRLPVIVLDPGLQERMRQAHEQGRPLLGLALRESSELVERIAEARSRAAAQGVAPVLLVIGAVRAPLRALVAPRLPGLPVLAYEELAPDVALAPYGVVALGGQAAAASSDAAGTGP